MLMLPCVFVCVAAAGKDRSMLIPNCLFRSNGSAVLLSNRPCDAGSAKYSIRHLVRTNLAADDVAFNCVMQTEDDEGKVSMVGRFDGGAGVLADAQGRQAGVWAGGLAGTWRNIRHLSLVSWESG